MSAFLWVGFGGFLGSIARYALTVWLPPVAAGRFPLATLAANCIGCLLIGVLAGVLARAQAGESLRLFVVVGILGGFTTFSAFGLESVALLRRGDVGFGLLYILGSVLAGLAAVWVGLGDRTNGLP